MTARRTVYNLATCFVSHDSKSETVVPAPCLLFGKVTLRLLNSRKDRLDTIRFEGISPQHILELLSLVTKYPLDGSILWDLLLENSC